MGIFRASGPCRLSVVTAVLVVFSFGGQASADENPRFGHGECRRVQLNDSVGGFSVKGAETITLSDDAKTVFASGYDRRSRSEDGFPPQGGLYVFGIDELQSQNIVDVRSIWTNATASGGFRPHGIALSEASNDGARLAVINRRYFDREPGKRAYRPAIELFRKSDENWSHEGTIDDPELCRANDLAFLDNDTLVITIDRSVCADFTISEDVFGYPGGSLLRVDLAPSGKTGQVERIATALLDFPNGIAIDIAEGLVHVATTKAASVLTFRSEDLMRSGVIEPIRELRLPGHPDNISLARTPVGQSIVAAVYPDLPAFAAYRFGWFGTSQTASKIVDIDESGTVRSLFEDPTGSLYSAASSAVFRDVLIAGSVGDEGLLVCNRRSGS